MAHKLTAATAIETLPRDAGTYALLLRTHKPVGLQVGKLGNFCLPAGAYVYVGSALGSGGIRARVSRHLRDSRRTHWHLDALLHECVMEGVCWIVAEERLECTWVRSLLNLPGAFAPITGFGSSDCSNGCPSHLVKLGPQSRIDDMAKLMAAQLPPSRCFLVRGRLLEDESHAESVLFP